MESEESRIKKESSIITYWKVLSMWYAQETHRFMDEGVLYDIKNVLALVCHYSLPHDADDFIVDSSISHPPFWPR